MKKAVFIFILCFGFVFNSYSSENLSLPPITQEDIELSKQKQQQMINELLDYDLEALDEEVHSLRGFNSAHLFEYLIDLVNQRVFPKHLRDFDSSVIKRNSDKEVFLNFKGISGGCYQFRLFHKHQDEFVKNSKWASSILTIPPQSSKLKNLGASVVLAPTLNGATMFIEGGVWSQLCEKGVTSLMPESVYKKGWFGSWDKLAFDPSPDVKDALDFRLYEDSIKRYERLLEKNLNFLENFDSLKTHDDKFIKDLPVAHVESNRIGFWGSSFGAIVGSLVVGKNPKLKGAVFTVGGGNLPYVVSVSEIDLFQSTREEQMNSLNIKTLKDYEAFISQHLITDPLDYFSKADKDRVYLIMAEKDTTVPVEAQFELYKKMGEPKKALIPAGHVLTLIYTAWVGRSTTGKAIDFLVERLQVD